MAKIKKVLTGYDTAMIETADKLRGDVPRSKYLQNALAAYNQLQRTNEHPRQIILCKEKVTR